LLVGARGANTTGAPSTAHGVPRCHQGFVKIGQEAVSAALPGGPRVEDRLVIEDLVAAVVGVALLIYLAVALAHPERF